MIRKPLLRTLFDAFSIRRWNDQIRPFELIEMDKHAHKMAIAYCLAKYEEETISVNWKDIIRGGVFELLRRSVLSDIKAPVYRKIQKDIGIARKLDSWVLSELSPKIDDEELKTELSSYLGGKDNIIDKDAKRILKAAHVFASHWEFQIIKTVSPFNEQLARLNIEVKRELDEHLSLVGIQKLVSEQNILKFIDLVGQLRFQKRWAQTARIPETSVLGHSMLVASIMYLFSRDIHACDSRIRNNFFAALFHDLPEALTRDIISPVKNSSTDVSDAISKIEADLVKEHIDPNLEEKWKEDFYYLVRDEFESKIKDKQEDKGYKKVSSDDINKNYNENKYAPLDGELVKVADDLAAYLEAYEAIETGICTKHLERGKQKLHEKYEKMSVGGIDVGRIYADFQ